jgi:hypothetical protein
MIAPVEEVKQTLSLRQWEKVFDFASKDQTVLVVKHDAVSATIGPRNVETIEMIVFEIDGF